MALNDRRTFLKTVSAVLSTGSVSSGIALSKETDKNRQTDPIKLTINQSHYRRRDNKKFNGSGPSPYPKLSWAMDLHGSMVAVEPVIADETLFLAVTTQNGPISGKGYVAAYDPETGEEQWKQTGLPAPRTPIINDGILYFSSFVWEGFTEGGLFAIDADTGELLWRRVEHFVWADPILADGQLYTEASGGVYALDPATGAVNWKQDDITGQIGYANWQIHPVDGTIFLGDGTALKAKDGSIKWRVTDENFTLRQIGDKRVYGIRSHSGSYTLEARSMKAGTVKWSAQLHATDRRSIQLTVSDNAVLATEITDENSIITAYRTTTGKQVWQYTSATPIPGDVRIADKRLLFRSGQHWGESITALDAKTGKQEWIHDVPASLFSGPVIADGTVYVGGRYEPEPDPYQSRALICAVDITSGEREWSYIIDGLDQQLNLDTEPPAAGIPIIADGRLYTATYPARSTIDSEYTKYANLIVLESTDQQPDANHRLPEEAGIEGEPPQACIKASPNPEQTTLEPGDRIILDAFCSSDLDGNFLQYQWTVDDEFESDDPCIEVAVPSCGKKVVRVAVTDSDGDTDTADIVITAS